VAGLKQTEETITLSKGRYLYVVGLICIMIQVHPFESKIVQWRISFWFV